jgi:alginate O-acetyltransferase complex protein AlgI
MPFNSYLFILVFLPTTVCGYWFLNSRVSRAAALNWLLAASVAFYAAAGPANLVILGPSLLVDFLIVKALLSTSSSNRLRRRLLCTTGIAASLALLGYFKYRHFFADTANSVFSTHLDWPMLPLPLGLSFLTFQRIAFLTDVEASVVTSLGLQDFLLFMTFFPRAIAGPIVHYREVMPQLASAESQDPKTDIVAGIFLFSIGLFKKAVLADTISQFVSPVFDAPFPSLPPTLLNAWIAALAYTLQLYFDFSGYSDMALGVARMFGVRLPMNFNSPLKARNIVEYWARWHITLTRFLTEYVYTPLTLSLTRARLLAGKRILRGRPSSASAIAVLVGLPTMITMAVSGLWHGAGWQFLIWGLLHGVFLTANQTWRVLRRGRATTQIMPESVGHVFGWVVTFGAVVIAMVFFRAPSVSSAISIFHGMLGANGIFSHEIQVLDQLHIPVPRTLFDQLQPSVPLIWISLLLLIATALPNSLEILRSFSPALDYSTTEVRGMPTKQMGRWPIWWNHVKAIRGIGPFLSSAMVWMIALLCVLGLMALSRTSAFVYAQF